MKNFIAEGNVINAIAPVGGVTSGVPVLIGGLFGIPATDAAAGETFALTVMGCFRLAKATGELQAGALAYWDADPGAVVGTASGNYKIGVVLEHAATDAVDCIVRLDGIGTAAAA